MKNQDQYTQIAKRLQGYLAQVGRQHPGIWKQIDEMRAKRGKGFPTWADWCFLPIAGYLAILSKGISMKALKAMPLPDRLAITNKAQLIAALAPWRVTQGIYTFHPEIFTSLASTSLDGPLPVDLFEKLPEWCCYIPATGKIPDFPIRDWYGFFVYLEEDANTGRRELRMIVDYPKENGLSDFTPFALHMDHGRTIEEALRAYLAEVERQNRLIFPNLPPSAITADKDDVAFLKQILNPLVSITLYLCSINAEIVHPKGAGLAPGRPEPKKIKGGVERLFPPPQPKSWEVGYRIGSAIQRAREKNGGQEAFDGTTGETSRRSPAPHIQRAHWHAFWVGPRKGKREMVVKWLPPIPVKVEKDATVIPTIRPVR